MTAAPHTPALTIVPYDHARHGDGPWQVVASVFQEYGFEFTTDGYDDDVARPDVHYAPPEGWFWVAEDDSGVVVGCVGLTREGEGLFELHRLYTLASVRRGGLGARLVQLVIDTAREHGCRRLVLFSDIALLDAHRLYSRMGFRCHRFRYAPDPFQSREWGFVMDFDQLRTGST